MTNTKVARKSRASLTKSGAPASAPGAQQAKPSHTVDEPSKQAMQGPQKTKLVRDSFTMPKDEYQVIEALKERALGLGKHVRKSELLRAGIRALAAMNDKALLKAADAVPTLKTGRPKAE